MPYGLQPGEFMRSAFAMTASFIIGSTVTHHLIGPDTSEPDVRAKEANKMLALQEVEELARKESQNNSIGFK